VREPPRVLSEAARPSRTGSTPKRARGSRSSAPESARSPRDESSLLASHWRPEAEGNCVVERRGGEQPEANNQSVSKKMLNSVRPSALTSLLEKRRSPEPDAQPTGEATPATIAGRRQCRQQHGMQRVVGDRMVGRCRDVNQGSRSGNSDGVHGRQRPEEPCPEGERASVGARKRGNARGAKGGRDVEAAESKSRTAKTGVVPERADRARGQILLRQRTVAAYLGTKRRRTKAALLASPRSSVLFACKTPPRVRSLRCGAR
jgi:hypothetical protein